MYQLAGVCYLLDIIVFAIDVSVPLIARLLVLEFHAAFGRTWDRPCATWSRRRKGRTCPRCGDYIQHTTAAPTTFESAEAAGRTPWAAVGATSTSLEASTTWPGIWTTTGPSPSSSCLHRRRPDDCKSSNCPEKRSKRHLFEKRNFLKHETRTLGVVAIYRQSSAVKRLSFLLQINCTLTVTCQDFFLSFLSKKASIFLRPPFSRKKWAFLRKKGQ